MDGDDAVDGGRSEAPDPLLTGQFSEVVQVHSSYTGPMPPDMLRAYDELVPGWAERYLAMTERSVTGHIDRDDRLADAEVEQGRSGQALAFGLTLIAMTVSVVFFALGNTVAGLAFLSVPLLLLIRSFLPGQSGGT